MTVPPQRIAFGITELDPGGAERALVELVRRLDRGDWEPRVFALSGRGELTDRLEEAGIPVCILAARSRRDLTVVGRFRRELKAFGPAVLQTYLFHANMAGRLAARGMDLCVVSGVRVVEHDARWRMIVDRWTNRLVTHNVCVSQSVARVYRELGIEDSRLSVIPNGVDVERFESARPKDLRELGIPAGGRTIVGIGRLHSQKGFDVLIEAVQPLLDRDPELQLLIIGEGPERVKLRERIASSGNPSRIHLVGWQNDIAGILQACEVFVLSSRWEGMPNVLLEAMAAGRPVVAADVEGVRDVVVDGSTGLVVAAGTPAALTVGVRRLLDNPAQAADFGQAGQAFVRKEFTWQRVVEEYVSLWHRLLTSGSPR